MHDACQPTGVRHCPASALSAIIGSAAIRRHAGANRGSLAVGADDRGAAARDRAAAGILHDA